MSDWFIDWLIDWSIVTCRISGAGWIKGDCCWSDRDAVRQDTAQTNHVLDVSARWRHLANTMDRLIDWLIHSFIHSLVEGGNSGVGGVQTIVVGFSKGATSLSQCWGPHTLDHTGQEDLLDQEPPTRSILDQPTSSGGPHTSAGDATPTWKPGRGHQRQVNATSSVSSFRWPEFADFILNVDGFDVFKSRRKAINRERKYAENYNKWHNKFNF